MTVRGMSFFFFKQKTAYELRISDWSSDVCSSDLLVAHMLRSTVCPRKSDKLPIEPSFATNRTGGSGRGSAWRTSPGGTSPERAAADMSDMIEIIRISRNFDFISNPAQDQGN